MMIRQFKEFSTGTIPLKRKILKPRCPRGEILPVSDTTRSKYSVMVPTGSSQEFYLVGNVLKLLKNQNVN